MQEQLFQALDTSWKLKNTFRAKAVYPLARLRFALNGIPWGQNWRMYGVPIIQKHRFSKMTIGPGCQLRSFVQSNPLGPNHPVILCTWWPKSELRIGSDFAMTGGTLCAYEHITIGDRVSIGANTTIVDTDFHPLQTSIRQAHPNKGTTAPVVIGNDVFIGMNCLILKGVTIGLGSVVGAGSVVTKDVAPCTIVAGNPARVIGSIA